MGIRGLRKLPYVGLSLQTLQILVLRIEGGGDHVGDDQAMLTVHLRLHQHLALAATMARVRTSRSVATTPRALSNSIPWDHPIT